MYKTETHLHTLEVSPCGRIKAEEMIRIYSENGYTTVFITDHLSHSFCDSLGDIPWQEKTAIFLSGYYKAVVAAKKYDVRVLLGAEINFRSNPNDYLVYGISKEFLDAYPDLCDMGIEKFYKVAKEHNVFVVQAHPFRDSHCFPTPESVDALEVYNTNMRHDNYCEKALEYALELGMYKTVGSDAHKMEDVAKTGVLSADEIKCADDYIELVKTGDFKIINEGKF